MVWLQPLVVQHDAPIPALAVARPMAIKVSDANARGSGPYRG